MTVQIRHLVLLPIAWIASAALVSPDLRAQEPVEPDTTAEGEPGMALPPVAPDEAVESLPDSVQLVDRVAAVVDDTVILMSEIQEELFRLRQQGMQMPDDPAQLESIFSSTLDQMISQVMLMQQAKRAGISISDQQVESMADENFARIRANFDSDAELRSAVEQSGRNMFQFREGLRAQARQELLLNRFRAQLVNSGELPSASVTEEEIQGYFRQNAANARRPATISFERLVVPPVPTEEQRDSARARAERALQEIRDGTAFEVAARRYSQDPGSRDQGGDLGWVHRSDVVPEFADAAWRAPPGRAVGPVETPFGFHVIRVENVRGGERQVRHILTRPDVTEEDIDRTRELAAALADSLRDGADVDRLIESENLADEQVRFEDVPYQSLGSRFGRSYRQALDSPEEGEVEGPFRTEGPFALPNFVVVRVMDYRPQGQYRLEDVREQIRERLLQQKQLQAYLTDLRDEMHVRILM